VLIALSVCYLPLCQICIANTVQKHIEALHVAHTVSVSTAVWCCLYQRNQVNKRSNINTHNR